MKPQLPVNPACGGPAPPAAALSWPLVAAALLAMLAAWTAGGSLGLLAPALRHALAWLALGGALVAGWPPPAAAARERFAMGLALAAAAVMLVASAAMANVLGVALLVSVLATRHQAAGRRALGTVGWAILAFALYRLALASVPMLWIAAERLGSALGAAAAWITGRPLAVGASMAGLDFLVLAGTLVSLWLAGGPPPRLRRGLWALAALAAAHLVYLTALAWSGTLPALLPAAPALPPSELPTPPDWYWGPAVGSLLPWNLPALGAALELLVAAAVLRSAPAPARTTPRPGRRRWLWACLGLAAAIPAVATLSVKRPGLAVGKIVACNRGYLDWRKPEHGRYGYAAAGLYGMLPDLVDSLGGRIEFSDDLAEEDLVGAALVVAIHPLGWSDQQQARVWDFVRGGGSLLVVMGPRTGRDGEPCCVNRLLAATAMQVRFDTAVAGRRYWQHACDTAHHPAVLALDDARCGLGISVGPSIALGGPARPLVVGRWGYSRAGSEAATATSAGPEPGERLGDLVLAAEQRVGEGRVVVLADHTVLANQSLPFTYRFAGRLLAYLAQPVDTPADGPRPWLTLAAGLALLWLLLREGEPGRVAMAALVMAASLLACRCVTEAAWTVVPQRPKLGPARIAYLDASHAEGYVEDRWNADGVTGFCLALARSGYLPLVLPQLSGPALAEARLLVLIAPARPYTAWERRTIRQFVAGGGTLIVMAGADRAGPVNPLLEEFGLRVPCSPAGDDRPEPLPMSCARVPYAGPAGAKAEASLFAGWPVEAGAGSEPILRGPDGLPVLVVRRVEAGRVALVGDSEFALNKNLETMEGEQVSGPARNVDFWRWFLKTLNPEP
jgi:hypothetical protein